MAEDDNKSVSRIFAKRLQAAMLERGWNQSEIARRAAQFMPDKKFGRDNISKYINEFTLPTPIYLNAIAKALGKAPEDLMPTQRGRRLSTDMDDTPRMALKTTAKDKAFLRINQEVPMAIALKIVELLGKNNADR